MWNLIPPQFRLAGIVGLALALIAFGAWVNGLRWQSRWDQRETEYALAKAEAASLAQQRQQLLNQQIRDIEQEYLNELDAIKSKPRPARVIRLCPSPAGVPAAGEAGGPGGADAGAAVREGAGATAGTDFATGPLIDVAARCDAQVRGLQGLLR